MYGCTDLFAGAGGSATGINEVDGVHVVVAANHLKLAMDVHQINHTETDHAVVDLHREDPRFFPTTEILWASPECTKWSQANSNDLDPFEAGDLLLSPEEVSAANQSRLLMFDVLRYIEHHRYRRVVVENVVDIATQAKYRFAWNEWCRRLTALGYEFRAVSFNSMHAHLGGLPAPQSRDRLYVVAWPKGDVAPDLDSVVSPVSWCLWCEKVVRGTQRFKPGREVGRFRQQYEYIHVECKTVVRPFWLPAASAIDWSIPGQRIGDRARQLAEKTRARIAAGINRYWAPFTLEAAGNTYDAADPKHRAYGDDDGYYRVWPVEDPLMTLHTTPSKALAVPVEGRDGKRAQPVSEPGRTQTCRAETGVAWLPFVSEARGGASVAHSVAETLSTVTASGNHHFLVEHPDALLAPYYSSGSGESSRPVSDPVGTLTTRDRYALVMRNNTGGAEMLTPVGEALRTLTTRGHQSLVEAPMGMKAAAALVDDAHFRMLEPHEVASGMAFPADYRWQPYDGKQVSKRNLVMLAGQAVTPPASRDLMMAVVESLEAEGRRRRRSRISH